MIHCFNIRKFSSIEFSEKKIRVGHLKLCLSHNLKTTETHLMKLHRKIKHNKKVFRAHELDSHVKGYGCNRVKGQVMPYLKL